MKINTWYGFAFLVIILINVGYIFSVERKILDKTFDTDNTPKLINLASNSKKDIAGIINQKTNGVYLAQWGVDAFTNQKWLIDKRTGIAMSYENTADSFHNTTSVRFSSVKNSSNNDKNQYWVGEYFCEPDNVIILNNQGEYSISYTPYFTWKKDFYLSPDNTWGRVSSMRSWIDPELNTVNQEALNTNHPVDLDIRHNYTLFKDKNISESVIYIKSHYENPVNLYYVVQDAAYMNFNKGDTINVEPISFEVNNFAKAETRYTTYKSSKDIFVGSYRTDYNIIAGFFSNTPNSIMGVSKYYLGNNGALSDGSFILKQENLDKIVTDALDEKPEAKTNDNNYVNRFIVFDVKNLKPGEERALKYHRVMLDMSEQDESITPEQWREHVTNIINSQL